MILFIMNGHLKTKVVSSLIGISYIILRVIVKHRTKVRGLYFLVVIFVISVVSSSYELLFNILQRHNQQIYLPSKHGSPNSSAGTMPATLIVLINLSGTQSCSSYG